MFKDHSRKHKVLVQETQVPAPGKRIGIKRRGNIWYQNESEAVCSEKIKVDIS